MSSENNFLRSTLSNIRNAIFGRGGDVNTTLDSIKADIYGNITDISVDSKIDNALNKLSSEILNKDSYNYAELMRSILTQYIDTDFIEKNVSIGLFQSPETLMRIVRYQNFDDICNNIPYCARALKVLADGVISPDNITKESIQIIESKYMRDDEKMKMMRVRSIKDSLELDNIIGMIVHDTMKYGDQFIEICHYQSKEVPITQSMMLTESLSKKERLEWNNIEQQNTIIIEYPKKVIYEDGTEEIVNKKKTIKLEIIEDIEPDNILMESLLSKKRRNKKKRVTNTDKIDIKDVRLIIHDPKRVVKIQTYKHKMNLGFLIMPENYMRNTVYGNIATFPGVSTPPAQFTGPIGLINTSLMNTLDLLYNQILRLIKKYVSDAEDVGIDREEMNEILRRAINDMEQQNISTLRIRYVPPERMEHFHMNNRYFFPYGESIFQKSLFAAKLLIALETAATIKRISDSSEKRLIYIDALLPRTARTTIESVKEALKKRRIGLDTFGSIGSIPSMITSFEDYYLPQRQGHKFVEFDTLAPSSNVRDLTDELKFFRDNIISSLEVPPAFLNIEENLSNKSVLAHESSLFAETIISYQAIFSRHLKSLFSKIYKYIYKELIPNGIIITFSPPRNLQIERESENFEVALRIINSLSSPDIGVPREYLKKKYLPLNWEEIEHAKTNELLDKEQKPQLPPEGVPPGF